MPAPTVFFKFGDLDTIPRPVAEFLTAVGACGPGLPAADARKALEHMFYVGDFRCLRGSWSRTLPADLWDRLREKVEQLREKAVELADQRWPLTRATRGYAGAVLKLSGDLREFASRLRPEDPPDAIVSLGDHVYKIGDREVVVTFPVDCVLQAFLTKGPTLQEPKLFTVSGVTRPGQVLRRFVKKYPDTAATGAVILSDKKKCGHFVRVVARDR
jgi:hypothetical protein